MKVIRYILLAMIPFFAGTAFAQKIRIQTGIEVLKNSNFKLLEGKRVGLITNPTGVDNQLKSTIDILHEAPNVNLVALFGPEHGVRGDVHAGDHVDNSSDPTTGLPVGSLYGKTRKATPDMLKGIDVLVYDIQDIGCRSFTYISTMGLAMEAAAENNIEFVVLDRPNPLGGLKVEGNLAEDGYISFVSQFKIPYLYGLTCGELAQMLNEENMLAKQCKLTVAQDGLHPDRIAMDPVVAPHPPCPFGLFLSRVRYRRRAGLSFHRRRIHHPFPDVCSRLDQGGRVCFGTQQPPSAGRSLPSHAP